MERPIPASAELESVPEYRVPDILVLDFDRMLGDVDYCVERLYTVAALHGIRTDAIREARARVEDDGGTFEPLTYIKTLFSDKDGTGLYTPSPSYEQFTYDYVTFQEPLEYPLEVDAYGAESRSVLYPDAHRLLARLAQANIPYIVMTYGVSPEWQQLKLMAADHPLGYTVTSTPQKSKALLGMRGDDGLFSMYVAANGKPAIYRAARLLFIDDKAAAFEDFPQDPAYRGLRLQRSSQLLPSQQGDLPPGVESFSSLDHLKIQPDGQVIIAEPDAEHTFAQHSAATIHLPKHSRPVFSPLHPQLAVVEHPEGTPDFIRHAPIIPFHQVAA